MSTTEPGAAKPFIARRGQARHYGMGPMRALFLADCAQTGSRYSVSEWWQEPRTPGPGVHQHEEDHIFYVLAGTVSLFLDGSWSELTPGSCAWIPGGTPHDFQNRGAVESGFLAITVPGGFEEELPGIVQWFVDQPLGRLSGDA
ncbi:MAG TPA: cupin domain-containing protein [Nevskia sp.]|nr:cupin domain-containing protein [Nevskia sp.]